METTEKIVEAYVRYVKGWFTIPNIKCGNNEIDLLAIDVSDRGRTRRYHIESGVSISKSYSPLTNMPFSDERLKERVGKSGQRRTLGFFRKRKFAAPEVQRKLAELGFVRGKYEKVIVTWGWTPDALTAAKRSKIMLWDFRDILREIADEFRTVRTYLPDDTLRTLQLMALAMKEKNTGLKIRGT